MNIQREQGGYGICLLTFDQAGSSANLFNDETLREFKEQLEELAGDRSVKGLILRSAKE